MRTKGYVFLDVLEDFVSRYLPLERGCSSKTVRSYKTAFCLLLDYLYECKGVPSDRVTFDMIDYETITGFLDWLQESRNCCARTRNQRLAALNSFSKYAGNVCLDAAFFRNTLSKIPQKKAPRAIKSTFTLEEVQLLLAMPNDHTEIGRRDKVLLSTMYGAGTRCEETCSLKVKHIRFAKTGGANIDIVKGKGGKSRSVWVSEPCARIIGNYIRYRKIGPESFLFKSQTHEKMSVSAIEEVYKKYIRKAKQEHPDMFLFDDYTPHTMRRSAASHMSHYYQRRDGWVYIAPSRSAIDRCKQGIHELITTHKRSQRELIESVNRRLTGWATHHRYTDARAAFAEIDEYVDKLLHQSAYSKHSKMSEKKVDSRYWFQTPAGASYYALPNSRHIHVKHLADVPIVEAYEKLDVHKNPYVDREYFQQRHDRQATEKMIGKYRTVWKRQEERCYYCGRPILPDQPRTVVPVDLEQGPLVSNLAYIHTACHANKLQVREVLGDVTVYSPRELLEAVPEVETAGLPEPNRKTKGPIGAGWIHMPLKQWFAKQTAASITLTFAELEKIDHRPLAPSARNSRANWYTRPDKNAMAEAWVTEGYKILRLSLEKEKVTFHRVLEGASHVKLPGWLKEGKIPDGAAAEIEGFLAYIKGKYGL